MSYDQLLNPLLSLLKIKETEVTLPDLRPIML